LVGCFFGETIAKAETEGINLLNVAWTLKNYNVLANLKGKNETYDQKNLSDWAKSPTVTVVPIKPSKTDRDVA